MSDPKIKAVHRIEKAVAELISGTIEKQSAIEQLVHIMDKYADQAIISYLEVEGNVKPS